MPTDAAAMMITKNALVTRLSLCRKRIMDGLGPSTLYARTAQTLRQNGCGRRTGIRLNAQLSLYAILCHYRRRGTGRERGLTAKRASRLPECPLIRMGPRPKASAPPQVVGETTNPMARNRRLPHRRWLTPVVVPADRIVRTVVDRRIAVVGIRLAVGAIAAPVEGGTAGIKPLRHPRRLLRADRRHRQRRVQVEVHPGLGGNPHARSGSRR